MQPSITLMQEPGSVALGSKLIASELRQPWYRHVPSARLALSRKLYAAGSMQPSTARQLMSSHVAPASYWARRESVQPPTSHVWSSTTKNCL
eukprot:scaffold81357_cov61-Phaeocystis_antarctica.AAC.1